MTRKILSLIVFLAVAALACTAPVSVTVNPGTVTLGTSVTQQFVATVTGNPLSTTAVTWNVNSIPGGNATVGTVDSGGLYLAPSSVPTPATVSVTAVSVADPSKSATAAVTISASGPYTLSASVPTGGGTISSSPAGIACPSTCSASISPGTAVTMSQTTLPGWTFAGWTGLCSGTGGCSFTMPSSNASVGATFTGPSGAHNYYVSPAGSDSNSGTSGSPWKTLQHAISSFSLGSGGAIIHVPAGLYNQITSSGTCASFGFPSVNVCVNRGGSSPSAHLIIQCDPGMPSAYAAVNQCLVRGGPWAFMVVTNNVTIQGFDIGSTPGMYSAIGSVTTTNTPGATAAQGNSLYEIGNYVHDLGASASGPEGVGCPQTGAIGVGNHHGVIQTDFRAIGNIVFRMGKFPSSTCYNTHGIYATGGVGAVIENNLVVGVPQAGIQITSTCGNLISNNTIINSQTGLQLSGTDRAATCSSGPGFNTVNNNIFMAQSVSHVIEGTSTHAAQCTSSRRNYWGANLTDGVGADWPSSEPYSCDTVSPSFYHATPSATFLSYSTTAASGANYRLNVSSTAVDHGSTTCATGSGCVPTTDLEGISRPQGSAYDIGAFEHH